MGGRGGQGADVGLNPRGQSSRLLSPNTYSHVGSSSLECPPKWTLFLYPQHPISWACSLHVLYAKKQGRTASECRGQAGSMLCSCPSVVPSTPRPLSPGSSTPTSPSTTGSSLESHTLEAPVTTLRSGPEGEDTLRPPRRAEDQLNISLCSYQQRGLRQTTSPGGAPISSSVKGVRTVKGTFVVSWEDSVSEHTQSCRFKHRRDAG